MVSIGSTDNIDVAKKALTDLMKQMKDRQILFDISDLPLDTPAEVNIARCRLEEILSQTDEINYAADQKNKWQKISDYMTLLIKGGGKIEYNDDYVRLRAAAGNTSYHEPPYVCMNKYYEDPEIHEPLYETNGIVKDGMISAAQIIYNEAQKYSINPQVLLALLKKESYVWGDTWPLVRI